MDAEQYLRDKLAANHLGTADVVLVAAPDALPPAEGPWVVLSLGAHRYAVGAMSRGHFRTYDTADTVEAAVDLAVHLAATPLSIEVTAYTEDQLTSRGSAVAQAIARRAAERGGQPGPSQVRPGDMLDVVGPATGHHLYPLGTRFPQRSQPPTDVGAEYHRYRVLQPLPEAQEGLAAPWFGQPGGASMIVLGRPIRWYVDKGFLTEISTRPTAVPSHTDSGRREQGASPKRWWKRKPGNESEAAGGDEPAVAVNPLPASRELFEDWLEAQHPRVARFRDLITPIEVNADFTRESFADLEQYILDTYPPGSDPLAPPRDSDFLDGAMRYIGETLLRHFGGRWDYDTSEDFVFRGRPFVLLDVDGATPISPLNQITALVGRREPLLTRLFDNQIIKKQRHNAPDVDGAPPPGVGSGSSMRLAAPQPSAWVAGVPERLSAWTESLTGVFDADLSAKSLPALTDLLRARIPTVQAFDDPANADFVEGAVTYLGETMRRAAGGRWVYGYGERDVEYNPFSGVPFLEREIGDKTIAGFPYWGTYDVAAGQVHKGPEYVCRRYVENIGGARRLQARGGSLLDRFHARLQEDMARALTAYDGFVVFSQMEGAGSVSSTRVMRVAAGKPPWFESPSISNAACDLGYDVLHDANVTGAAEGALVTTYRCSDESWTDTTYFGHEALPWFANGANIRQLVEQVRPV